MSTFTLIDSTSLNDYCITRKHFKSLPKPCQIFNGENSFMLLITIEKRKKRKGYKNFFALLFTLPNKSYNVTFICDGDSFFFLLEQRKLMSPNEKSCAKFHI